MKQIDTLIVGFGLAGLAYAETLRLNNRSFHIIDQAEGGSSIIAAGIYNPTVLKRFNMTWQGAKFHAAALPFYQAIEQRLSHKFLYPLPVLKLFSQAANHNQWVVAADRDGLSNFIDPTIFTTPLRGINTPYGYAKVNHCGRLDTTALIDTFQKSVAEHITKDLFDYSSLSITTNQITYKNLSAKRIVFCEGYAMVNNPYFFKLPLEGSKGQILIIEAPQLKLKTILKGPIFIVPLGGDKYWAGASFERQDKTLQVTSQGEQWLKDKIDRMINVPYSIKKHITHIRPTVKDRRPLIGTHHKYPNLHLLNGMGSRGVLTAPTAASWLFNHIENKAVLPQEVDINRFEKIT